MPTREDVERSPEVRWEKYPFQTLETTSRDLAAKATRLATWRLLAGGGVSLVVATFGYGAHAAVLALVTLGLASLPISMEAMFQRKLIAGGIGMLIEELRALHWRLALAGKGGHVDKPEADSH